LAIDATFNLTNAGNTSGANLDASWLLQFLFRANQGWSVSMRSLQYVFESVSDVKFYFVNTQPVVDALTLTSQRDQIRILKYNQGVSGLPLPSDQYWLLESQTQFADGFQIPSQVQVQLWDSNQDAVIDDPQAFERLVTSNDRVFWKLLIQDGYETWQPVLMKATFNQLGQVPVATSAVGYATGDVIYVIAQNIFLEYNAGPPAVWRDVSTQYKARVGRGDLNYCWQHYASRERRIDPAVQNVIDLFVLTNSYDQNMRTWVSKGKASDAQPQPPSPEDLRRTTNNRRG
jgi:hypothetical protein